MMTLPNLITLLRFPLALAFFQENPWYRAIAIFLAMISDSLDGYLARRYGKMSRLGTILDPLADKLFVLCALSVFLYEGRLQIWEALTMLSRDFSVLLFGLYLKCKGDYTRYRFRAIWCGKIMTALQFMVLLGLVFGFAFPPFVFLVFLLIGAAALIELACTNDMGT
jgi:CDP-diacylglycerol--glycerol-3-phosphate 3-phosphatidyltransferase